ncbi:MAG: MATE family efflux transporter [Bacteroidaceae bacterium]|nr:MATE family efflux transporter [Bacteroidaceae bacterium]
MKRLTSNPTERRVAKNSLLLLVRMALLMVINLVAVRYVRKGLGVEDYGILNAATGLVQIVICLKSILATSTQRFISMALGKNNLAAARDSFSVSVKLSREISFLILLGMETVGLWFVCTQMNCPPSRFTALLVVYQLAVVNFILTLLQVPYLAVVLAYEKMNVFAFITVAEGIINLASALLLFVIQGDRMIFYAFMLIVSNLLGYVFYTVYVHRRINGISYQHVKDGKLYREVLSFSGWTIYGSVAGAMMLQGNMLALNVFVGPMANAAFAVALQLYNAISSVGNNVIMAVRPQMVMNYSRGNYRHLNRLFFLSTLALIVLLAVMIIPLEIWMSDILGIWLGDADSLTIGFSRLMIVVAALLMLGMPITIIMHAVGCVRQYHLIVETITILCLPVGCLFLSHGYAPESVCWSIVAFITLAHVSRLFCFWKYYYRKI